MPLLDWLRKLGILRFGAEGAVYHNAKERPVSLMADNVFNSEEDVLDLDRKAVRKATPGGKEEGA